MIYAYTILILLVASALVFTISYLYFIRQIRKFTELQNIFALNFAKVYRGYLEARKKSDNRPGKIFYLHFVSIIIPIFVLILISWIIWGTPSVKKDERYLISNNDDAYIFVVTDIQSKKDKNTLFESINYRLYKKDEKNTDMVTSFIKYRSTKKSENEYFLERIDGTDQIVKGTISFAWSYGSDNFIYIYLEDGTKLERI